MNRRPLATLFFAALAIASPASEPTTVTYKQIDGRELTLRVIKPADWQASDHRPALVWFHGGSWTGGAAGQFASQANHFATRGLVNLLVTYRLVSKDSTEPPLVCVQDAKSALRWVRTHAAALGIDPERIGAGGGSAGGHLASFAALVPGLDDPNDDLTVSPRPAALLLFNPVFDNGPDQGWGHERVGHDYRLYSPAHHVHAKAPPTLVMVGTRDALLPVAVVTRFKAAMDAVGARCDLLTYEGQPHGFFNPGKSENDRYYHETLRAADDFLVSLDWLPPATKPETP